jgi:hypothetical protein
MARQRAEEGFQRISQVVDEVPPVGDVDRVGRAGPREIADRR